MQSGQLIFQTIFNLSILCSGFLCQAQNKQDSVLVRSLHYSPENKTFVSINGTAIYNRSLYAKESNFRIESGDIPRFALYLPGYGGCLNFGIKSPHYSKWLSECQTIKAIYTNSSMIYLIEDPLLNKGKLKLSISALKQIDGLILQIETSDIPDSLELISCYGGLTGKKLPRSGDLGTVNPAVFNLKAEYCINNSYQIRNNQFTVSFGTKRLTGSTPVPSQTFLKDSRYLQSPQTLLQSSSSKYPVLTNICPLCNQRKLYWTIYIPGENKIEKPSELFTQTIEENNRLNNRLIVNTPDPWINSSAAALPAAADALWNGTSYVHGAIAWRSPLNGWRAAYLADDLGWHKRAQEHFTGYFKAQYTNTPTCSSKADPKTNLSRQYEVKGTKLFSSGYISRYPNKQSKPHHYDMNLVFIDEAINHLKWTGDTSFQAQLWPVLKRHLNWEKRNFDQDGNGLYDAYAAIWASDAISYSGGGVAYSSAYNYKANLEAARISQFYHENNLTYLDEAKHIQASVNKNLWLTTNGWYAEYKDQLGNQLVHPSAGVWSIYHPIDKGIADKFQKWQATDYIEFYIPHIPFKLRSDTLSNYYELATSDWMPYTWSVNNVAMAEVLNTALAYWQAGKKDKAFQLYKSCLIDFQFLGNCPGNFGQLSALDVFRGELYRDFGDAVGVAARALIEGLFGIQPDMIHQKLTIQPGWPVNWKSAQLHTSDIDLNYLKTDSTESYNIRSYFPQSVLLNLKIQAKTDSISAILINGIPAKWKNLETIGKPAIEITTPKDSLFSIQIRWKGIQPDQPNYSATLCNNDTSKFVTTNADIIGIKDPQGFLKITRKTKKTLEAKLVKKDGVHTAFILLTQGQLKWWAPLTVHLIPEYSISSIQKREGQISLRLKNNTSQLAQLKIQLGNDSSFISIPAHRSSKELIYSQNQLEQGINTINIEDGKQYNQLYFSNWNKTSANSDNYREIELNHLFNATVPQIFTSSYLSPRSSAATLSIPVQGYGDWCNYNEKPVINDSGLRKVAAIHHGKLYTPQGIPFQTTGNQSASNIIYCSLWNNFPDSVSIQLSGKSSHLYLLMTGSVNPMQIDMENGLIQINYTDGTKTELPLISPKNWWPIEQDYFYDGYAFNPGIPLWRLKLKTGEWYQQKQTSHLKNGTIKIEGGAASLLDLPLNPIKELSTLKLITKTRQTVLGIIGLTLKN